MWCLGSIGKHGFVKVYQTNCHRFIDCILEQLSLLLPQIAVPLDEPGIHVVDLEYSPLVGGFAVVLSDGRAAFLTASTLKFDPNVSYCGGNKFRILLKSEEKN